MLSESITQAGGLSRLEALAGVPRLSGFGAPRETEAAQARHSRNRRDPCLITDPASMLDAFGAERMLRSAAVGLLSPARAASASPARWRQRYPRSAGRCGSGRARAGP